MFQRCFSWKLCGARPSARAHPCLSRTLCQAVACSLLLGRVRGYCGEAIPRRPACASNLPAAPAVLLAGFAMDVSLSFEPPTQCHSLPPFFFPSGAVFLCSVSWERLPLPLHLEELAEGGRTILFLFAFSPFTPIEDMYYLQVIYPRQGHHLQLLFHLWHLSLFIFIDGLHCLSSVGTQPASQQQACWVGFEAHLLIEKATGKLK